MAHKTGAEELSGERLRYELELGARFVTYTYVVSALLVSLKRPSPVYYVRSNGEALAKSWKYTLFTLLFGWWSFPLGPIFVVQALYANFRGGKTVTSEVIHWLVQRRPKAAQLHPVR